MFPCALQIAPMITGGVDPAAAASMSDTVEAASLATRFPNIDTTKHVVMEVKEPDFMAKLAEGHEEREALLKASQTKLEAELAARKNGKPTSFAASSVTAGGAVGDASLAAYDNITTVPMVTPKDAQALAEAMAASAGEGASKNPADYLASATSVFATYSTPPASSPPQVDDSMGFEGAVAAQPVSTTDGRRKLLQTNTVHDLLVVYTPAAAASAGGDAGIQNTIRIAVEYTNLAYANSRIPMTVRLVGMRPVRMNRCCRVVGLNAVGCCVQHVGLKEVWSWRPWKVTVAATARCSSAHMHKGSLSMVVALSMVAEQNT